MSTPLSYDAYTADGVQAQYDLTFGYLSRSHVFVFVDDVLSSYRWVSGTRVQLNLIPDPGQIVRVQRLTDRVNRIVDFADGTTLLSGDLNASDLQSFYILQEIADQIADGVLTGSIPINEAGSSYVTEQWINQQLESNAYSTQAYIQLLQRIIDEEIARAQAVADEADARAAALAAEALQRALELAGIQADVDTNYAEFVSENTARLTETSANATSLSALLTRMGDAEANILADRQARVDGDGALTQSLDAMNVRVGQAESDIISVNTAVATESSTRTTQINSANSRIDGVEAGVSSVTQTQASDNQARVDDIADANVAIGAAQADATSALSLVATEQASRITEVSRLETNFQGFANSRGGLKNSRFEFDEVGHTSIPQEWSAWLTPNGISINASVEGTGEKVAYLNASAGQQVGIVQRHSGTYPGSKWLLVARVRRRGGTFNSAGIHVQYRDSGDGVLAGANLHFSTETSHDGQTGDYPDGTVTYSMVVDVPSGLAVDYTNIYAMASWNGFPGGTLPGCQIDWYEVDLIPLSGDGQLAVNAQATADQANVLIASETAARASALDSLTAQYRSELPRNNLIPGPYRVMEEVDWVNDSKFARLYNADFAGTGGLNPWTSTDAFKILTTTGDGRIAFTPDTGGGYFALADRVGVALDSANTYALRMDVAIDAGATSYTLFARGNDDGLLYTVGTFTPAGGRQQVTSSWSPSVTQKYSFELQVVSPSGVPNNWIYRLQLVEMFSGENHADIYWIDDDGDDYNFAQVNFLKDALATGSSSQARLFMGVNTANNEAFIEQYAGEGDGVWNGSKIKFSATQFEFDGAAIFNQGALSAAGTAVNFTVSGTAPSSPVDGEWWADSAGGSLYIRLAGAWQLISNISLDNAFRLTGAPVVNAEAPTSSASANAVTGTPGISALNATGTVAYAWYRVGGDASIACSNTAIANPTWSGVPGAVPSTKDAAWRCVATDLSTGDTAIFDVIVRLTNLF